ncbi:MAG TPA: hypothetical protein VJR89_43685, partial [Polyangiales bacterium]|nr:hypothetical protein [Polyangiales bacterium]
MSTTRRKLLTSGAAALTALAGAGVTSRLFGRGKAETPVASRAPKTAREIERVLSASSEHWVGDGFRVRG